MKLTRVKLTNYRLHRATDFVPGPNVNLFHGLEGMGKTTIPSGLEWAFNGRNSWLGDNGSGSTSLIRGGEKKASVGVAFVQEGIEGTTSFERTIPSPDGVRDMQAGICKTLGVSQLVLEVCLRPVHFFDLPSAKQQEILWSILGDLTDEDYQQRLNSYNPQAPHLGDYYYGSLRPAMTFQKDPAKHIKDVLLRECNTRVKVLEGKLEEAPPHNPQSLWRQADWDNAVAEKKAVDERITGYGDTLEDIKTQQQAWDEQSKEATEAQSTHSANLSSLRRLEDELTNAQLVEQAMIPLSELQEKVASIRTERDALRKSYEEAKKNLSDTKDRKKCAPGECLLAGVLNAQQQVDKCRGDLEAKVSEEKSVVDVIKAWKANREFIDGIEQSITDIRLEVDQYQPPIVGPRPESDAQSDLRSLVSEGAVIQARIDRMLSLQAAIRVAEEYTETWSRWEEKLDEEKRLQLHLGILAEALGPAGVRAQIMESKVTAFVDEVNNYLCPNGDTSRRIAHPVALDQMKWEWSSAIGGAQVPIDMVSDSQKIRQCLAVVAGIAIRTGFGVIVGDRMESMHPTTLVKVIDWLRQLPVQSFLLRTGQEVGSDGKAVRPDEYGTSFFAGVGVAEWWVHVGSVVPMRTWSGREVAV